MNTHNTEVLRRSHLWSTYLKEILEEDLSGMNYVDWLDEFPDGDTFLIPSIGQATVRDYVEDTDIVFDSLDTGEFQFQITDYISSAHYITKKARQDLYYAQKLEASFLPKQRRAIEEHVESRILGLANEQVANDLNMINGAAHRFVASGTSEVMSPADFAKALYSLKKAAVPQSQLVAIVDPSVEYAMNTQTSLVNVSDNPKWEGIIADGIATGMRFVRNIYGFDVYTSNFLADANETIDGKSTTAGKANLFFSASGDILPFIGAWRQMPEVDGQWVPNKQREEYITTARYGVKLYRPENLVVVLSDTDQVF